MRRHCAICVPEWVECQVWPVEKINKQANNKRHVCVRVSEKEGEGNSIEILAPNCCHHSHLTRLQRLHKDYRIVIPVSYDDNNDNHHHHKQYRSNFFAFFEWILFFEFRSSWVVFNIPTFEFGRKAEKNDSKCNKHFIADITILLYIRLYSLHKSVKFTFKHHTVLMGEYM